MSLPTITIDDFTGQFKISDNVYNANDLDDYISASMERYLREILGDEAYILIRDNVSLDDKYQDLVDGVIYQNTEINSSRDVTQEWVGLTDVLVPLIYFDFVRDNFVNTPGGNQQNRNENSDRVSNIYNATISQGRYNEGVARSSGLTLFLENYNELIKSIDSFTYLGGEVYQIDVSSTFYLNDGDIINYQGTEYTVSSLVTDTSFEVSGPAGLAFIGSFSHKPFFKVVYCPLEYAIG